MNNAKVVKKEILIRQIKSLIIFDFLDTFNYLEEIIRETFEKSLSNIPNELSNKLFFYYGGKIGTSIDTTDNSIRLETIKYKKDELFKKLTVNQIIKIYKTEPKVNVFDFNIDSIQKPKTQLRFSDCVLKLISMRNRLAHEMNDCNFIDKDIIEVITIDKLKTYSFDTLVNFDISNMDNMTQCIASNIVYMRTMISSLNEKEQNQQSGNT